MRPSVVEGGVECWTEATSGYLAPRFSELPSLFFPSFILVALFLGVLCAARTERHGELFFNDQLLSVDVISCRYLLLSVVMIEDKFWRCNTVCETSRGVLSAE